MPDLEQAAVAICDHIDSDHIDSDHIDSDHIDALQRPRIAVVIDENDSPADGYQRH
jgi:hypothetical protein